MGLIVGLNFSFHNTIYCVTYRLELFKWETSKLKILRVYRSMLLS